VTLGKQNSTDFDKNAAPQVEGLRTLERQATMMDMSSQRESLEESRDFWEQSAKGDRRQFLASFAIAAAGVALVGVGIGTIIKGDLAGGALGVVVGTGFAVPSVKMGLGEVQDFADMTAQTAVRQNQIDELTEA